MVIISVGSSNVVELVDCWGRKGEMRKKERELDSRALTASSTKFKNDDLAKDARLFGLAEKQLCSS